MDAVIAFIWGLQSKRKPVKAHVMLAKYAYSSVTQELQNMVSYQGHIWAMKLKPFHCVCTQMAT
jgi:hypothetical protein